MLKKLINRSLLIIMMIAAMGMTTSVWAQGPGQGRGQKGSKGKSEMHMKMMLPDLTKDQMDQIKTLRTSMLKQTNPIRAEIREKKAHLQTLSINEKPDMAAINKTIDEIGALKTKMMKIRAKFRQDVRALLTDEQRVIFDSKAGNRMGHGMKGQRGPKQGQACGRM